MDGDNPQLLGFLFGNVDEDNNLEADYLDEVMLGNPSSRQLALLEFHCAIW